MHRVLLMCITMLAITAVNAQTQKGSFLVGGTASIQSTKGASPGNSSTISVAPQVGYFLVDNLAVGITPSITYSWRRNDNTTNTGIGPFVRYYFPFGKFAIFPELKASFGTYKAKGSYEDPYTGATIHETNKSKSHQYSGGVGFVWFAAENVGLEAILSYNKSENAGIKNELVAMRFGIQFYISRNSN